MKRILLTACLAGGFFLGAAAQDSTAIRYAGTITASDMERHLSILASDSLEGRETGKRGQKMAADYIKNHFQQIGLQPAGDTGSHYQSFELEERSWGPIYLKTKEQQYDNFEDVIYYGNAHIPEEKELEAVFVGRGRPQDYEGLDVKGKAVVIFDTEDKGWRNKLKTAREQGAAAYIVTSGTDKADFTRTVNNARLFVDRPRLGFKSESSENSNSSIFFFVAPQTAAEILNTKLSKLDKAIEKKEAGKEKALRRIKPSSVAVKTERIVKTIETENVLGFMEGSDLKDEILIVTSHYDHIGMNEETGEIFNGADDDGSGTTTVLEIAEAFAEAKEAGYSPRRSILFMTVTGEEKGLLGSEYYTNNPVYPLAQTVTNLNIDMVGRSDKLNEGKEAYIYLIGSDKLSSELHTLSENVNKTYTNVRLDYSYNDESDPNRYYYRSDHYNFAKNNIPVIFYFNGTHDDYHKSTDTVDKINFPQMEKRGRLVFHTAWEIANRDQRVVLDQEVK